VIIGVIVVAIVVFSNERGPSDPDTNGGTDTYLDAATEEFVEPEPEPEPDAEPTWKWIKGVDCDYGGCWHIEVVAPPQGCPNALYAELQITDSKGTVVDFSNDSLGSLKGGQKARLTFNYLGDDRNVTGDVTEVKCY
jgi:hypothetical protein